MKPRINTSNSCYRSTRNGFAPGLLGLRYFWHQQTETYRLSAYPPALSGGGKIDRIVCKSISRFARNTSDFIAALDILHESHVTILFEKEGLDTADSTSDFILTTLAAIAQEESRSISSNILWGIQKRYPKGQVRNYGIYGYRFAKGEGAMETLEDGYQIHRVEVVEKEAKVVRRIFHAVDDGMSYADVARMLNFEHIKAPNHGKPPKKIQGRSTVKPGVETGWTVDMISRMVSLERYCGDALLQKTYTPDFLTHKSRKKRREATVHGAGPSSGNH